MQMGLSFKQSAQGKRGRKQPLINGGARRDRTADLLNAIQALSQLSYGPDADSFEVRLEWCAT
jgi:hypothetical protein